MHKNWASNIIYLPHQKHNRMTFCDAVSQLYCFLPYCFPLFARSCFHFSPFFDWNKKYQQQQQQRLTKRDIEQQASQAWINDRAKEVIDIDDNIPFSANNASTNDSTTHTVRTATSNATTTPKTTSPPHINVPVGKFVFESTSLKTETIVLLLMFGICTIIYSSKYRLYWHKIQLKVKYFSSWNTKQCVCTNCKLNKRNVHFMNVKGLNVRKWL